MWYCCEECLENFSSLIAHKRNFIICLTLGVLQTLRFLFWPGSLINWFHLTFYTRKPWIQFHYSPCAMTLEGEEDDNTRRGSQGKNEDKLSTRESTRPQQLHFSLFILCNVMSICVLRFLYFYFKAEAVVCSWELLQELPLPIIHWAYNWERKFFHSQMWSIVCGSNFRKYWLNTRRD